MGGPERIVRRCTVIFELGATGGLGATGFASAWLEFTSQRNTGRASGTLIFGCNAVLGTCQRNVQKNFRIQFTLTQPSPRDVMRFTSPSLGRVGRGSGRGGFNKAFRVTSDGKPVCPLRA